MNSSLSAFVFEDAILNCDALSTIAKYIVFSSTFSGKSPSSLINIIFSPLVNLWPATAVKTLSESEEMRVSFTLVTDGLAVPSSIKIFASLSTPLTLTNNLSFNFAPMRKPCVTAGGLISSDVNPNK